MESSSCNCLHRNAAWMKMCCVQFLIVDLMQQYLRADCISLRRHQWLFCSFAVCQCHAYVLVPVQLLKWTAILWRSCWWNCIWKLLLMWTRDDVFTHCSTRNVRFYVCVRNVYDDMGGRPEYNPAWNFLLYWEFHLCMRACMYVCNWLPSMYFGLCVRMCVCKWCLGEVPWRVVPSVVLLSNF